MIRRDPRLMIDKAAHFRIARPAENTIQPEDRAPGRECRVPRAGRQFLLESMAQRAWPEPVIKIAEHHRHHRMATRDFDQSPRLGAALCQAQSEMSRDQSKI